MNLSTRANPEEEARQREVKWTEQLSEMQYRVLREKGTEAPFTGKYLNEKRKGKYMCAGCGLTLYHSNTKFDSGSGWPSFFEAVNHDVYTTEEDSSLGVPRTELVCANCNGHIGHLFDDGPAPTGMRHCVNSAALTFEPEKQPD